jgi:hypothetical protein
MDQQQTQGVEADGSVDSPKNKRLFVLIIVLFTISMVAFVMIKSGQRAPVSTSTIPEEKPQEKKLDYDWAQVVQETPEYTEARALTQSGQYDAAVSKLQELMDSRSEVAEKSVVDMDIAAVLFQKDPIEGAERYAGISSNTEYPDVTRGTAFLQIYLQFVGTANPELVRPFFTPEEFEKYGSAYGGLRLEVARRMHHLFPFVTAGAVLARQELLDYDLTFPESKTKPIAELNIEAERIYEKYFGIFDSNIAFLERGEAMRQYIPNTYLAKANFLADLDRNGYVFARVDLKKETVGTYEEALTRARAQGATITEQFILSRYVNYLLAIKEDTKAETLVKVLIASPVTPMFKGFVPTERARLDMPFFVAYATKNADLKTYLGM